MLTRYQVAAQTESTVCLPADSAFVFLFFCFQSWQGAQVTVIVSFRQKTPQMRCSA
jgi:hypothetical protein